MAAYMRHVATHLASLGVLFLALVAPGVLLQSAVAPLRSLRTAAGFVPLTLGITLWVALLFMLASLGILRAPVVETAAFLAVAVSVFSLWRNRTSHSIRLRAAWLAAQRPRVEVVAIAAIAIVLFALLFISLTPFVGWDDNVAHLTLPRIYLESGGFRRVPFNIYSNWPLDIQLLYAMAMLIKDYILAKLVHLTFLLLTVVAVYRLASAHSSQAGGVLAAVFLLANPVILDEARSAYIDIAFAFFFVMAFAFALEHLRTRRALPLIFSGICCGIVAGTKIMGAVAAPCIGALVIVNRTGNPRSDQFGTALRDAVLCIALPAFVLALPWYLRSYVYTGNPFYPLFYQSFGGPEWNSLVDQQFFAWQQSIGMGRRFVDYLLLPARVALQGGNGYAHFDGRLNPIWVVLVPYSLAIAPRLPIVRQALGVAGLYFLTWAVSSQQARFLIPILPFLAIAAGASLAKTLETRGEELARRPDLRPIVVMIIAAVGLLWTARFTVAEGLYTAREMARHDPVVPGEAKAPIYRFISDELPPGARLMLLNTNQGFFVDREFISDSFFEASQINALLLEGTDGALGISRRLHAQGVTHILLEQRDWGIPYPSALREFLGNSALTELIYRSPDGRFLLFSVRSSLSTH